MRNGGGDAPEDGEMNDHITNMQLGRVSQQPKKRRTTAEQQYEEYMEFEDE